jgi:hypothetical protein
MTPRTSCRVLAVTFAMTSLFVLGGEARATTVTILPSSQDTYVDGSSPNHIYGVGGTANRMFVQPSNGVLNPKIQRALVQFDLSSVPQFSTISSAILEINEQSGNLPSSRTHGVHRATAAWAQGSVKWNTQPTANASPTSTQTVGTSRGYKSFDVTSDVQASINSPAVNHGWLVKDQTETGSTNEDVGYVTREDVPGPHDDETRPKLTITFTAPLCSTDAQCADTNPCTTNEHCAAGNCVVDPVNCDDGNACTDDICDAQQGCMHPLANCDDGFSCTTDSCNPNTLGCTHTPMPAVCAHDGCQTGTCVADQNNNTLDPVTGCMVSTVAADGAACNSDGLECTADQCLSGECTHPDASFGTACSADGNSCTDDVCDGSGACHVNNTASCNDGNGCTQTDQCSGGQCLGSNPVVCTALDQCHVVGTCDTQTGLCSDPAAPSNTPCNDNDACTSPDQCDGGGQCVGGNPVVCSALDQCHDAGICDTQTGVCSNPPKSNGAPCNDNDACTQTDQCNGSGSCIGGNNVVCSPPDQCHDTGTCDTQTGVCSNPPKSSGSACNDSNACTQIDECNGSGSCVGGNPVVCSALDQCHDVGTCDTQTGVCSDPPKSSGASCNDNDACTQTDQCAGGGQCVGGNPVVCTPLDQCHDAGTCDTQTGTCSNPTLPDGTICSDANSCTLADACSGGQCLGNPQTCGDHVVQPSCNEECDDNSPGANCTAQCRFICGPTPQAGCRAPALANKASVILKNKSPDKKDGLTWKWIKGAATTPADLGTPLSTTGYTLCVYDASANPQPLILAMAPPGGTCHGKPCWKTVKGGFKYGDKDLTPDGLSFLLEKSGAAGAAKVIVKGKGANLGMMSLPLTTPVTVQLKRNDNPSNCWTATYSTTTKNQSDQLKAKAD